MMSFADIVRTTDATWIIPTRLVTGLLLVFPIGSDLDQILAWCTNGMPGLAAGSCAIIRGIEILCGAAFFSGMVLRIFAAPALLYFALRAIANIGNSVFPEHGTLLGFIHLIGDWQIGIVYIVPIVLMYDFVRLGSGRWSIDFWLSGRLKSSM